MSKKNRKYKIDINEKSFFATSESVGEHWRAVNKSRRRYDAIKGKGSVQTSKPLSGVVVVNPVNFMQWEEVR